MLEGLRTGLQVSLIGAVLALSGCVSSNQTSINGGNFDREEAARTRMSLGLTYLQNNNYTQAKKNLDKALEFNPRSADVQYAMAYYYQLVGDNKRAEDFYEGAIDLAPENGDIANSFGAFKCQNGEYDQAKNYFFEAINNRLYANAAQTYENLALCAQSQGKLGDAIEYFKEALKHQPARGKTLFLLTESYIISEQWDAARTTLTKYEKVARVTPDSLWLAHQIALGQKDVETAKSYGEMLVSMYPDNELTQRYIAKRNELQSKVSRTVKQKEPVNDVSADAPKANDNTSTSNMSNAALPVEQTENTELSVQTPKIHVVKAGENLYRISLLHNIKMATLQKWNNLEKNGAIIAGQSLWLVPPNMQEE